MRVEEPPVARRHVVEVDGHGRGLGDEQEALLVREAHELLRVGVVRRAHRIAAYPLDEGKVFDQQRQVEAMAAASDRFALDSTALSKAKEVISGVRLRLDVAQRMFENDIAFSGEPVEGPENRNVIKEIDELFDLGGGTVPDRAELPIAR